jgi:hypothetical protein
MSRTKKSQVSPEQLQKVVAELVVKKSMDYKPVTSDKYEAEAERQRSALSHWLQIKRKGTRVA